MRRAAFCLLFVSLEACSAEPSGIFDSDGAAGAPVAPSTGADEEPSAATSAGAMSVFSWGFEPASGDCNGWPVFGADAIRASPACSGAYSCKVCSNGSASNVELARDLGPLSPGRYVLTAWVRKRPQNAAPLEATARIDATVQGVLVTASAPAIAVREEWDRVEATIDLAEHASNVRVIVGAPTEAAERCLFVDDVSLGRWP